MHLKREKNLVWRLFLYKCENKIRKKAPEFGGYFAYNVITMRVKEDDMNVQNFYLSFSYT